MRLFDYPLSGNGYKVRLLLAHLDLPYQYIPVDILKGETRTPAFLEKNPNGRIPLLELENGTYLAESNAILYLLAQNTAYWPNAPRAQAQVLQWMFFEQYSHEPNVATARFWLSIRKLEPPELNSELLQQKQALGRAALEVMDDHLRRRSYFVGESYSIAAHEGGFDLNPYPAVREWLGRVRRQPRHVTIDQWRVT
jgi:glutathione S-transferase